MTPMPSLLFWFLLILGLIIAVIAAGVTLNHRYEDEQRWSRMNWWIRTPFLFAWFILPWVGYLLVLVPWRAVSAVLPPCEDESAHITRFDPQGGSPTVEKP